MTQFYDDGVDPNDLSIKVSDMLVATAHASDELIDSAVSGMLLLLRERLKMEVVFVSEFVGDQQTFRYVDAPLDLPLLTVGESNPQPAGIKLVPARGRWTPAASDPGRD